MLDEICKKINHLCLTKRIARDGCTVSLRSAPKSKLVIDLDHKSAPTGPESSRCDFLFISERDDEHNVNYVVPLELKKGDVRATEVVRQLRAGTKIVDCLVPKNSPVEFRPTVVYGGKFHRGEKAIIKKKDSKISFRGRATTIGLMRCGSQLVVQIRKSE